MIGNYCRLLYCRGAYSIHLHSIFPVSNNSSRYPLVRDRKTGGNILNENTWKVAKLESARKEMQTLLNQMQNRGVELFVDGITVSPGEAVAQTVNEDSPYMADYVLGENGSLRQVRFDRVTSR